MLCGNIERSLRPPYYSPAPRVTREEFLIDPLHAKQAEKQIADVVSKADAKVGLYAAGLDGDIVIAHEPDQLFAQASAIKVPLLVELYEQAAAGELSLQETLTTQPEQIVGGCGVLQHLVPGSSQWSFADLAVLMIQHSDNVATNLIINRVGRERVNERLAQAGYQTIRLRRKMMDMIAREAGQENQASPQEAARYMQELFRGRSSERDDGPSQLTETHRQEILRVLRLPKTPGPSPLVAGLPKGIACYCKPGMLPGLRTEWGVVVPNEKPTYVIAMMATSDDDTLLEPLLGQLVSIANAVFC